VTSSARDYIDDDDHNNNDNKDSVYKAVYDAVMMSSWHDLCESSPGSLDECRTALNRRR